MLEARALTKCFSSIPAVLDVSFRIAPGQVLGYLGPNGSGKSTTVKMLTGLIEPTRGQILYNGDSIRTNLVEYKRTLGYVPEEANLYPHLTGYEYLELVGHLRDLDGGLLKRRIETFLTLFSLFASRNTPVSAYSKGMRQRLLISSALLHDPRILIFDEPEAGLDITTALVLRKLISSLAEAGKVILYSSHILEVVEKVCTHVLVLHKGIVVAHETIAGIGRLASKPDLEHVFSELTNQTDTDETARGLMGAMRMT
jgi:ABC-2 type transport system ATP-binding protein